MNFCQDWATRHNKICRGMIFHPKHFCGAAFSNTLPNIHASLHCYISHSNQMPHICGLNQKRERTLTSASQIHFQSWMFVTLVLANSIRYYLKPFCSYETLAQSWGHIQTVQNWNFWSEYLYGFRPLSIVWFVWILSSFGCISCLHLFWPFEPFLKCPHLKSDSPWNLSSSG